MQNKVLIVGGTGYLGRHLIPPLNNLGYETYITGLEKKHENNTYYLNFAEVKSFEAIQRMRFDLIIILASSIAAIVTKQLTHPDLISNSIHLGHFLEFISKNKIGSKIVYISTMTVYGTENKSPIVENGILNPIHTYGLSKVLAENITSYFCHRNNIKGIVLRIPGLYGGNRKSGFIYNTIRKLKNDEEVILNTKNLGYWEAMHIEDLVQLMVNLFKHYSWNKLYNVFNICYGQETDFYKTAHFIGKILKKVDKIIEEPKKQYTTLYLSNEKLKNIISVEYDYYSSLKKYISSF